MFVCRNSIHTLRKQDKITTTEKNKQTQVPVSMDLLPSVKDIHLPGIFYNMNQISLSPDVRICLIKLI